MLRPLLKLAIAGLVLFALYKAVSTYYLFRLMDHFAACYPQSGTCTLAAQDAAADEVERALGDAMSCVRQRQGVLEAVLHPVPMPYEVSASASASGRLEPASREKLVAMCRDLRSAGS